MKRPSKWLASLLSVSLVWAPIPAIAEDIDIFTGGSIAASNPTILFLLDNQAQWANAAQKWPNYPEQGKSEVAAIKDLLADPTIINSGINVGMVEFNTEGNSGGDGSNNGGFVRFPILPMDDTNKEALSIELQYAFDHINDNQNESRSAGAPYGTVIQDVYNYLTGGNAVYPFPANSKPKPQNRADSRGYTTPYSTFKSPLTAANGCGRIFMIFIGNNTGSVAKPTDDSAANKTALSGLSCSTTSLPLPNFVNSQVAQQQLLNNPAAVGEPTYASQAACETAAATRYPGYTAFTLNGTSYKPYECIAYGSTTSTATVLEANTSALAGCKNDTSIQTYAASTYGAGGYSSYTATPVGDCTIGTTPTTVACGTVGSQAACESANPGTTCTQGASCSLTPASSGTTAYASSAACTADVPAGYASVTCSAGVAATNTTYVCGKNNDFSTCTSATTVGTGKLPAAAPATYTSFSCTESNSKPAGWPDTPVCSPPNGVHHTLTGTTNYSKYTRTATGYAWTATPTASSPGHYYNLVGNTVAGKYSIYANYAADSSVPTGTYNTTANNYMADEWTSCLHQNDLSPDGTAAVSEAFTAEFSNPSGAIVAGTITFDGATTTLAGGETPAEIATKVAATAYTNWIATSSSSGVVTFSKKAVGESADIVAGNFTLGSTGAAVIVATTTQGANASGGALGKQNVTTYVIDVYNAKQNSEETALFMNMAQQGGGRYFAAKSQGQILNALKQIVSEIQSVNTAFAAASIPLSTTNRSQNLNEVYIGVFRPSLEPRWFGNLKKFKIAKVNGVLDLVDSVGTTALNSQTGFLNDCAVSYWTTDSGAWWDQVKIGAISLADNALINPVPRSSCLAMPAGNTSPWSDMPDGQSVEKGAVAEVIRRGNNPPTTATTPTWTVNRNIYTRSGSDLVALDATNVGSTTLYDYIRGVDINVDGSHVEEKTLASPIVNAVRASVHGDVVHSRPLAVNYGTNDTVIYYGANDGMLRAVDGLTGQEKWAFIPSEFLDTTKQTRLMQDRPLVALGSAPAVGSTRKNYMFDGSPGLYQSLNNTKVWLFPTQRRGGRMVHALDVTSPGAMMSGTDKLLWYQGCPNLANDTGCTTDFSDLGQTWSVPVVTKIKGYTALGVNEPVVVFGGGYDDCEDAVPGANPPSWTSTCGSSKGRAVYVVDAKTGALIKKFTIAGMRGVTAGVSFVDINNDGYSDYAYVADLGGTIYRLSFIDSPASPYTALDKTAWTIKKVAYTSGARKFMFAPAVTFAGGNTVYAALGSGDRERPLAEDYPFTMNVQNYVYAYRDTLDAYNAATTACNLDGDPAAADACVLDYTTAPALCSSPGILPIDANSKKAWRVGFVYQGEQAVTQPVILGGLVVVNTTRPVPAGVCSTALGEGGGYFLNLINGSGAIGVDGACGGEIRGTFTGVGLPTDPVVVNLPGEDPILIGSVSKTNTNPSVGSKLFQPTPVPPPIPKTKSKKYRYTVID